MIFVAKHSGGYCAWQTDTTDYSLKTSPWKDGKGDMVGDLAMACRKEGLRFGIYLCPRSDIHKVGDGGHAADAEKQKEYNEIYRRQLTEILTNYGPMFEMWFDGGNIVPVNDLIAKLRAGHHHLSRPAAELVALGRDRTRLRTRIRAGTRLIGRRARRRRKAAALPRAMSGARRSATFPSCDLTGFGTRGATATFSALMHSSRSITCPLGTV